MSARAVYTALFGAYESLNEDQATADGVDFLCFTDNPELTSDRWRVVVVEPVFPLDPHRSQRRLKIVGHPALDAYEQTLYIDNTVSLTGDVHGLFDEFLGSADMAMVKHSFRANVALEFAAVWRDGLDDPHRVMEQWDHYATSWPKILEGPVLWGGMIARRRGEAVTSLGHTWFEHVLRYSRRDQLSAPVALALHPEVDVAMRDWDNQSSAWHRWPVEVERNHAMRSGGAAMRVPLDLKPILETHDRLQLLERESARALGELNAMKSSASWRLTAPLRRVRAWRRRTSQ